VRIALGASRLNLMRQLAVEAALLATAGCAVGWLLAAWATPLIMPWLPPSIPRLGEVRIDRQALLFAVLSASVTTMLLGLAPLGTIVRARAEDASRLRTRGALGDRSTNSARQALVVGEIATALVLLLTTTGFIENLWRLRQVQPGFDPEGVFHARVSIPPTYRSADAVVRFYERMSERIAVQPGVQHVGVISAAPLSGLLASVPFSIAGRPAAHDRDVPSANLRVMTPGYLAALGTRLKSGRPLSETDGSTSLPVALVSAALADRFLAPHPIGRQVLIDDNSNDPRPVEVVGVVEDVRQTALDTPPTYDIYIPLRQIHPESVAFISNNQFWMIKLGTDPGAFRVPFLTALREVDPDAAVSNTGPWRTLVDAWFRPRRFTLALIGAFSCTALLLAVLGVYTLVSYTVSQRRQEIGLRMAIGASAWDVRWLILGQAARLVCAGLAAGLFLTIVARPIVPMTRGAAPASWLGVLSAGVIVVVVIAAAWLPARRATRLQPGLSLDPPP
jgi:predicted permease